MEEVGLAFEDDDWSSMLVVDTNKASMSLRMAYPFSFASGSTDAVRHSGSGSQRSCLDRKDPGQFCAQRC